MNGSRQSVPTTHFDELYARSDDPWGYESGDYEQRKYARTLNALPRRRYGRAFELGCSIGVLTDMLSRHCDHILGGDCSEKAIDLARQRHARDNIDFEVIRAPEGLPSGKRFDLIVLSEVLYFFTIEDLNAVARYVAGSSTPAATIVLVNFLGSTEHAMSGDEAANAFVTAARGWSHTIDKIREEHFRIDILERTGR